MARVFDDEQRAIPIALFRDLTLHGTSGSWPCGGLTERWARKQGWLVVQPQERANGELILVTISLHPVGGDVALALVFDEPG